MTLQATLAAIANVTSLTPAAKPVPATAPVVWVAQQGPRRFHAAVKVQDEWVKVTAGGRPAAVKRLREELSRRGTPLPAEVTVREVEPEVPAPASAPVLVVPPPAAPAVKPTVPAPAPKPVPALVGGRVTPLTDKARWAEAATAAIAMASSLDLPDDPREAVESFRRTVDETLKAAGYVGAYQRLPNGELWIRLCRNVYDPTSRAPRAGDGARRISKDINGMPVDSAGASLQLKDRKKAESSEPKYEYGGPKEAKQAAWKQAAAFSATCRMAGLDKSAQTVAYKLGYVAAIRAASAPDHVKFVKDLESADAAVIAAVTAALKG
jgi:hypothetical protein